MKLTKSQQRTLLKKIKALPPQWGNVQLIAQKEALINYLRKVGVLDK